MGPNVQPGEPSSWWQRPSQTTGRPWHSGGISAGLGGGAWTPPPPVLPPAATPPPAATQPNMRSPGNPMDPMDPLNASGNQATPDPGGYLGQLFKGDIGNYPGASGFLSNPVAQAAPVDASNPGGYLGQLFGGDMGQYGSAGYPSPDEDVTSLLDFMNMQRQ